MLLVKIVNKTGNPEISSYEWETYVNHELIAKGKVKDFKRSRGWRELVKEVADSEDLLTLERTMKFIEDEKAWNKNEKG